MNQYLRQHQTWAQKEAFRGADLPAHTGMLLTKLWLPMVVVGAKVCRVCGRDWGLDWHIGLSLSSGQQSAPVALLSPRHTPGTVACHRSA